jgi:hypothetical protein
MAKGPDEIKEELIRAGKGWGKMIDEALDARFGKNRSAYCLILCTTGNRGSFHITTNINYSDLGNILREAADKLKSNITLN